MTRTISNPTRGCGHLKRGKGYVRGVIGSPDGVLPSFVRADPPIPFREMGTDGEFTRGFLELNGIGLEAAAQDDVTDFVPMYPGDASHDQAVTNLVDRGMYDVRDDVPDAEAQRHFDRIRAKAGLGAEHFGDIDIRASNDLLMRAGKTHYPDPGDYIDETVEMGISKAIPLSKRQEPPTIEPGLTRIWIVHPDTAVGWAVIGFAYVQEVVFTEPEDGNVPDYVQDWARQGALDVVDIEPAPDEDDGPDAKLDSFKNGQDPSASESDAEPAREHPVERRDPWGQDAEDGVVDPGPDDPPAEPSTVVPNSDPDSDLDVVDLETALKSEFTYNDLKAIAGSGGLDLGGELGPHPDIDTLAFSIGQRVDSVQQATDALTDAVGDGDD